MLRFITALLFTSLVVAGCHKNKTPSELIDTFAEHREYLNLIVNNLGRSEKLDSLFHIGPDSGIPDLKNSYPEIYALIRKAGITDASSHENVNPKKTNWYYFKTDWSNEYPVYLIFNAYDSTESFKGFYKKDEYENETWGLGDNWKLFRFVKVIPYKQ